MKEMTAPMKGNPGVYVRFYMKNGNEMVDFQKPRGAGQPDITPVPWKGVPVVEKGLLTESYDLWKAGLDAPVNGLPLEEWPPMHPDMIPAFGRVSIQTVEDLAAAAESLVRDVGPMALSLHQKAQAWLKSSDRNKTAERIAALEEKQDFLQKELTESHAREREMAAKLQTAGIAPAEATQAPAKRGPGRPKGS